MIVMYIKKNVENAKKNNLERDNHFERHKISMNTHTTHSLKRTQKLRKHKQKAIPKRQREKDRQRENAITKKKHRVREGERERER